MNRFRRRLLAGGFALAAPLAGSLRGLHNPCQVQLPLDQAVAALLRVVWKGSDPRRYPDFHGHLPGTGGSGSGSRIDLNSRMETLFHPMPHARRLLAHNAGCVHDALGRVDGSYVERMLNRVEALPPGASLLLFAFDRFHDGNGPPDADRSSFHTQNAYARRLAERHPLALLWPASIHSCCHDCFDELAAAVAGGARAVKWLPPAMGIDPSSPLMLVREHSPLPFDFVVERQLASQGHRFAPAVFETRGFFAPRERKTA
ncbi:MAG: hypothetical protein FAZ92_03083 [Accumulibacter sp.]|uniref:hypothetical protein n=1 Tax=Accumulibacter sp. TaxID=2053492 RepID=UPI0011F7A3AF|nr:hypothetical protein [Accumulibacter sp.]TLD44664.1 MAG: hypothetical protein FAZ92_03083 [Accumulibacter sp.]